jgi:hypothetical protein
MKQDIAADIAALAEAVRLARRELDHYRDPAQPASAKVTIRRLRDLLGSDDVDHALATLAPADEPAHEDAAHDDPAHDDPAHVDDAPSMKSDPPVDLRVPYPWRSH